MKFGVSTFLALDGAPRHGGRFDRVAALGDAWLANSLPPQKLGPKIDRFSGTAARFR